MNVSIAVRAKFHGFNLASELNKHNALRTLFTSFYGNVFFKRNNLGFQIESSKVRNNYISAVHTYGIKYDILKSDDFFGRWVSKNLTNEDIVVTWGLQALPIIERAKELGIKVIVERGSSHVSYQRNILYEEFEFLNQSTSDLDISFSKQRMERELLEYELADYISIPSSFVKRSFLENGIAERKLFQNPYGVNLDLFRREPIDHKPFRIIYAGSISFRKGVHYLLEAFNKLKLHKSELWLVGQIEQGIEGYLKKYESENIKILSPVAQDKLSDLFNQCDVFVIYSIEEGMAMVQAQAMGSGLPVICTTNTGGDDIVEDGINGYVLPIRRPDILAERLEYLYRNRDIVIEMGNNAYKVISGNYTWSKYGERANMFYKNILR